MMSVRGRGWWATWLIFGGCGAVSLSGAMSAVFVVQWWAVPAVVLAVSGIVSAVAGTGLAAAHWDSVQAARVRDMGALPVQASVAVPAPVALRVPKVDRPALAAVRPELPAGD